MIKNLNQIEYYFPEKIITNNDLSVISKNLSEEDILKRTGISQRFESKKDELASDMAVTVAETFFKNNKIQKEDIDFLIFCSECFDYIAPATSCIIQNKLGLSQKIGCIDLPYGCSGYVYGLALAKSLLISGMAKNILFITADTPTKTIQKDNVELRSIFSDAAAVTFLDSAIVSQIGEFVFGTNGEGWKNLYAENSAFRKSSEVDTHPNMLMDGIEIFNFGLKVVPSLINDTLEKNHLQMEDIDLFIFHQPTTFLLETLRKKLKIPEEKFIINIGHCGNTVSSTIPIALNESTDNKQIKEGMKILIAGFGIGYSWAATVLKT